MTYEQHNQELDRYCVIGAGPSGLAVAKNLISAEISFDAFERQDDIGGNWYFGKPSSSVYQSTRLISSKRLTEFTDYPIPDELPEYLHHTQALDYLRGYARRFGLYERIHFNSEVQNVVAIGNRWQVDVAGRQPQLYRGVIIANGHNWDPQFPKLDGDFTGTILHSSQYKTPEVFEDKRVLVVGAGNSGCDIAVEAAQHASKTFHSTRRGYHYLPKFVRGKPVDQIGERMLRLHFPLWLRRLISGAGARYALGAPGKVGLPQPDHRLFETHPIVNSQLYYFLGHGAITPKGDVQGLCGDQVRFADGTTEKIDVIVFATGFKISFPFIDKQYLNWQDGRPELYLNIFHPTRDNLFVVGLIQPDSGQWGLTDYQAQLVARVIKSQETNAASANSFRKLKAQKSEDLGAGIRYVRSTRHLLEVEHYSYRKRLKKLISRFDGLDARTAAKQ